MQLIRQPIDIEVLFISTLAMICTSLLEIGYALQYLLKLSSTMSIYQLPLIVSDIETRSTYSFSPTYPVSNSTCSPVLTGILLSGKYHICHSRNRSSVWQIQQRTLLEIYSRFLLTFCALQHHSDDITSIPPTPLTLGDISIIHLLSGS